MPAFVGMAVKGTDGMEMSEMGGKRTLTWSHPSSEYAKMVRTDAALLMIAIALSIFGALVAVDLVAAINAQPCGSPGSGPTCYPWGTEGPSGSSWRYQSKTTYFLSGFVLATFPVIALVSLGWKCTNEQPLTSVQRGLVAVVLAVPLALLLI